MTLDLIFLLQIISTVHLYYDYTDIYLFIYLYSLFSILTGLIEYTPIFYNWFQY